MSPELLAQVRGALLAPIPEQIRALAKALAEAQGAQAALFYGSILRTADPEGLADLYLLTDAPLHSGLRGWLEQRLWPEVSYREAEIEGRRVGAKVAVMTLAQFRAACAGEGLDTTVWTRFTQPAALAYTASPARAAEVVESVAFACETAARFAAALGPAQGTAADYWRALFRRTYAAELRVEQPGREDQILRFRPDWWTSLPALAWASAGVAFTAKDGELAPNLSDAERSRLRQAWGRRERAGKPLNAARLMKAAFTFEGAARYAAWKIERHTGVAIAVTPWRERHPILAAPGAAWRLWRARRRQTDAR